MEDIWRWRLVTSVAPVLWGATYLLTRELLPPGSPLWGGVIRALPAGLLLLAVRPQRPRGSWWWRSALLGALDIGAFFVLVYVAAQLLPSSIASTLMSASPAVMLLLAWPLLGQRPHAKAVVGVLLGVVGVAAMLLTGGATPDPRGVAASLAAMVMSSVGFVLTTRWRGDVDVLALTSWQLLAGGFVVVPFALAVEGGPPVLDATELVAFAFLSLVATAIAYAAWFTGLAHLDAGSVGLIGLLNPVTGVLLGVLVASERLAPLQVLGAVLVLGGIALGQRRRVARTAPATTDPRARRRDPEPGVTRPPRSPGPLTAGSRPRCSASAPRPSAPRRSRATR